MAIDPKELEELLDATPGIGPALKAKALAMNAAQVDTDQRPAGHGSTETYRPAMV